MQHPFTYTRFFRPLKTYDYRFWGKFENNLANFIRFNNDNPMEFTDFDERVWNWPHDSLPRPDLYNIIKLIAKITKVKVMWKNGIKGPAVYSYLLLIGERNRVIVCHHVLTYAIEGIFLFEEFLKKNEWEKAKVKGFPSRLKYARTITGIYVDRIMMIFALSQVEDKAYKARLENYIMGQYKLDYKQYGQEVNAYWNAVSKTPHTNRMML